jgi:transcriptional repressor NrdR
VKSDCKSEPFDRKRLERSIRLAAKGRGASDEEVAKIATDVAERVMEALGNQPIVTTGQLSAEVLRILRDLDHIAYLQAASTIKSFKSVEDYRAEAEALVASPRHPAAHPVGASR